MELVVYIYCLGGGGIGGPGEICRECSGCVYFPAWRAGTLIINMERRLLKRKLSLHLACRCLIIFSKCLQHIIWRRVKLGTPPPVIIR